MILLCPPEKSTQFHYPLDPTKIHAEGSMHKDTTYQGSDRQDFYRHGKKIKNKNKPNKKNKTNKLNADLDWFAIGNPVKNPRNETEIATGFGNPVMNQNDSPLVYSCAFWSLFYSFGKSVFSML